MNILFGGGAIASKQRNATQDWHRLCLRRRLIASKQRSASPGTACVSGGP
jgi:hypothetical protein